MSFIDRNYSALALLTFLIPFTIVVLTTQSKDREKEEKAAIERARVIAKYGSKEAAAAEYNRLEKLSARCQYKHDVLIAKIEYKEKIQHLNGNYDYELERPNVFDCFDVFNSYYE